MSSRGYEIGIECVSDTSETQHWRSWLRSIKLRGLNYWYHKNESWIGLTSEIDVTRLHCSIRNDSLHRGLLDYKIKPGFFYQFTESLVMSPPPSLLWVYLLLCSGIRDFFLYFCRCFLTWVTVGWLSRKHSFNGWRVLRRLFVNINALREILYLIVCYIQHLGPSPASDPPDVFCWQVSQGRQPPQGFSLLSQGIP